mmetsp:Transcript_109825/g.310740  ORF Transcript_109825/g.310740 Transcript_109825/m.310740 type:complete len:370 (-) Transcript_109825:55-1164(-)
MAAMARRLSVPHGEVPPPVAAADELRPMTANAADCQSWIDVSICEAIVSKPIKIVVPFDGEFSMTALTCVTECLMMHDRSSFVEVLHVWDDSEPGASSTKRENLRLMVDAKLTASVSARRYKMSWVPRGDMTVADHVCRSVLDLPADYTCLGFRGTRGMKNPRVATTVLEVLRQGNCSVIVIKDESTSLLPIGRPTKFVVSVSLNKASTKAFLDSLRLSRPGDEIRVVYVKGYLENTESDYTQELRQKYDSFFSGLKDGGEAVFSKFHDRSTGFAMIGKQKRETTPQAIVRYADNIDADFIVVGTNAMRVERGNTPLGSAAWQVCLETDRNFVVANWVDVNPRVYEAHVRRGGGSRLNTPAQSRGLGAL